MVRGILNLFQREIGGLHEAAYLLGFTAILSQLLALVRDRLLAHHFGAGEVLDIYYAAFRVPDFIYIAVGSLVSISVLIPFLVSELEKGKEPARRFLTDVFVIFFAVVLAVSALAYVVMPKLAELLFPGFSSAALEEVVSLSRILLLSPILLSLSNLFGSVTQVYRKFFVYSLAPILYNVGIILGIIVFFPIFGLKGLAYGVAAGALFHMLIQLPSVLSAGLMIDFSMMRFRLKERLEVILLSLPRAFTLSLNHIALLVLTALATLMHPGSLAVFNLAFSLQSVPLSIIGVSYSVAAFPTLTRLFSSGERTKFLSHMMLAARHIIFLSLPALTLFIVLRAQIVRTILGSGNFTWSDTRLTAAVLAIFAVSLAAQSLSLLFIRGYYAGGNTRKPLFIGLAATAIQIVVSVFAVQAFHEVPTLKYFFETLFKVEGLAGSEVLMLPLGYSVGAIVNVVLFWVLFQRDFSRFSGELNRTFFTAFSASIIGGFAAYAGLSFFGEVLNLQTVAGIFFQGLLGGALGIGVGIITLALLKSVELKELERSISKRIFKTETIAPQQDEL